MANRMKAGTEYELFVKSIYESFLQQDGLTTNVELHKKITGKSGAEHEIDVFWQFEIAGKTYRTAIECKHFNSRIDKGRVQEFVAKLADIGDISGIMATKVGFQSGAEKFGIYNNIEMVLVKEPEITDFSPDTILRIKVELNLIQHKILKRNFSFDEKWLLSNGFTTGQYNIKGNTAGIRILNEETQESLSLLDFESKYIISNKTNQIASNTYAVSILFNNAYLIDNVGKKYKIKKLDYEYTDLCDKEIIEIDALNTVEAIIKRVKDGKIVFMKKKS